MRHLIDNWREYQMLHERVNTLDSGKRFIGNRLREVTEEYSSIQISQSELEKIKVWGGLAGEPEFLGSGSKGIAYKFGNRVLKITEDTREAEACALIVGKYHPNVYDVYAVGRRSKEDQKEHLRNMPYIIVYGFLDYPNKAMADVTQLMYHKIRKNNIHYKWEESFLRDSRNLMYQLRSEIKNNSSILGKPVGKYNSIESKINEVSSAMGWSEHQKMLFSEFWTIVGGMYNPSFNSVREFEEHISNTIDNPKLRYFHQLALGLTFLNKNGVVFTDLMTTNVMEKDDEIAIIDIGKSNVKKHKKISSIK
jgi:serine/threonine protein kinase